MDENNRAPQRTRPRPYDLRRKVLLKNFLREQMTHIPLPPPQMPMEEDDPIADPEVSSSSSIENEENIEQPNNIQDSVSSSTATEPMPSTSTHNIIDETPTESQPPETEVDKTDQPTFSRLSNLLRLKINSVRNRKKGIQKAKLKMKAKSPSHQSILRSSNKKDSDSNVKGKQKSFFSMFKSRQAKKRKEIKTKIPNSDPEPKSSTSNQSVQTEACFSQEEFNNMEQSNRCLREENRLLSESLSNFMSDYQFQLSPLKIPYGTDSYITASGTSQVTSSPQPSPAQVANNFISNDRNLEPRVKIPRSKSMQERLDKRINPCRPRLRTRSMNYGLSKRFYDSSSLTPQPYRRGFAPHRISPRRGKYKANSFSTFDTYSRRSPPEENPRIPPHRPSVLKNLPINNSNRAIIRRSSMPERTYPPARPVMRHKSTRINGYNRGEGYDREHVDHNYNVNGNVPIRRRSNAGDYGRPVPFQNLPSEAFY